MSPPDARAAFDAAEDGAGDWMSAATAFAATPEGHKELLGSLAIAQLLADTSQQDRLHAALLRGEFAAAEQARSSAREPRTMAAVSNKDLQAVADDFGVALEQVRRDHAVSHILSALSRSEAAAHFTFYGGTALSRTLLPRLRLSEDIDLIADTDRTTTAQTIDHAIETHLARTHGDVTWEPRLSATRGTESAVLRLRSGVLIKVQMMTAHDVAA